MNKRNQLILRLRAEKLSYSRIGEIIGITRQRVHQILKGYVSGNDVPSGEYICSKCGSKEGLQCHHIDFDPHNHDKKNLEWLCTACHAKKHKGNKKEPYYGQKIRAWRSSLRRRKKTGY